MPDKLILEESLEGRLLFAVPKSESLVRTKNLPVSMESAIANLAFARDNQRAA